MLPKARRSKDMWMLPQSSHGEVWQGFELRCCLEHEDDKHLRDTEAAMMRLQELAGPKRVDLLYLTDSLLQNCRNAKNSGCGPDSAPGQVCQHLTSEPLP